MLLEALPHPMPETMEMVLKYAGSAAAIAGSVAGYVAIFKARRKKAMAAADHPSVVPPAPPRQNPFGTPPPTDPGLRAEVQELRAQVAQSRMEWQLADARRELAEVRRERDQSVADARRERDEAVNDARDTAAAKAALELKVDAHNQRIATLEQALADERERCARVEAELARFQRPDTAITPLRPKARP